MTSLHFGASRYNRLPCGLRLRAPCYPSPSLYCFLRQFERFSYSVCQWSKYRFSLVYTVRRVGTIGLISWRHALKRRSGLWERIHCVWNHAFQTYFESKMPDHSAVHHSEDRLRYLLHNIPVTAYLFMCYIRSMNLRARVGTHCYRTKYILNQTTSFAYGFQ